MRTTNFCLAVAMLGLAPLVAQAEFLPTPAWTFATGSNPSVMTSDAPGGPSVVIQGHSGPGAEDIVAATFHTFSNSPKPTMITPTPFTETVFITADGHTAKASFNFLLTGSISSSAAYLGVVPTGDTSERLHLDHFYFDVTLDPFHAPATAQPLGGWLSFDVRIHPNPEPSTLLLAGIGVPLLALLARRRAARTVA